MGRPKKPIISRELVIKSALAMIDRDGLDAVSLRRLAETIGVNIGSLYHHYRYKDDILLDVLAHVLEPLSPSPEPIEDWKEYFRERCKTYFQLMVAHPNLTSLMFTLLPRRVGLAVEEQGARVLLDAGVPARYVPLIREQLESAVHGVLRFCFDTPLFANVTDSHPVLARVVAEAESVTPHDRLALAVDAILDGVEHRIPQWR